MNQQKGQDHLMSVVINYVNFLGLPTKTYKKSINQLTVMRKHKRKYGQQLIMNIKTAQYIQAMIIVT